MPNEGYSEKIKEDEEKPNESLLNGDFSIETTEDYENKFNNNSNHCWSISRVVGNSKQKKLVRFTDKMQYRFRLIYAMFWLTS